MNAQPYLSDAPWPCMRGGLRSRGVARVAPASEPIAVRHFRTGGPVFSTPVIGADEEIYVGSADRHFYRLDPRTGRVDWRVQTGEVIDSAACIGRDGTVFVPAGDGRIYGLGPDGTERWRYDRAEDHTRFTPSTIWWWEGNAVLGPTGWLYAGNDDFYVYAIEPFVGVRWAVPTGLHLWGAPAFDDERLFVPSFDRCLYALDPQTGAVRWRTDLGNFIASSPAVGGGLVYVGCFDGTVVAVEADTGTVRWRTRTGGPVYASVALAGGLALVGSADGNLYALDATTGAVRWTTWLGDAIRGSAAVSGDRVYVPGGDGRIRCLDAGGTQLWAYDTASSGPKTRARNLNASIALGRHGLATASASGDVIYLPWDPPEDTPGLELGPDRRWPDDGAVFVPMAPGGVLAPEGVELTTGDAVAVRVVHREGGRTLPVELVSAHSEDGRARLGAEPGQVHVEDPGADLSLDVRYRAGGVEHTSEQRVPVRVRGGGAGALPSRFRVSHMSIQSPSIVPSFDQIGLASLAIDIGILEQRGERVLAWGIQRFGLDDDGAAVGVPEGRTLLYALHGTLSDGVLALEATPCSFEITAFPVPLTRLRLVARLGPDGLEGSSLLAEADGRDAWRALTAANPPRSWLPDRPGAADLVRASVLVARAAPVLWGLLWGMWRPWGLLDADRRFHGLGAFAAQPLVPRSSSLTVERFTRSGRWVRAELSGPEDAVPGVLFLDRAGRPCAVDYTRAVRVEREGGRLVGVRARVPADAVEAWVLVEHEQRARLVL